MPLPRITVLTAVYNGARYLAEAIESVLADGFEDFEYVIVDDGSTDATPRILADAAARDPRIVLLRHEPNRGIAAATNRGLAIARGAYIARLDADDISLPGRLAREAAYLDAHPAVALVSMNFDIIDAGGAVLLALLISLCGVPSMLSAQDGASPAPMTAAARDRVIDGVREIARGR